MYSPTALANIPIGTAYVCNISLDCGASDNGGGGSKSSNSLALGLGIGLGLGIPLLALLIYLASRAFNDRHVAQVCGRRLLAGSVRFLIREGRVFAL